jgi:hypothetical protein
MNSPEHDPQVAGDPDEVLLAGAGGGAYMEVLPDTFVLESDRAIDGLNLGLVPGSMGVLLYKVQFAEPGRYYVWSRIRSNGPEDNTMHVGLNDSWPLSGQILQFPKNMKEWFWNNQVRFPVPNGEGTKAYIDVPKAGDHNVMFSMREDGHEFDRFVLTRDATYGKPEGIGPPPTAPKAGQLPATFPVAEEAKSTAKRTVFQPDASGLIMVEAEGFSAQDKNEKRAWYLTSAAKTPSAGKDIDPPHLEGIGGGAYLEVLPDTGNDGQSLTPGENISDQPGAMAVLHYWVDFPAAGKYYIWARCFGFDGDDNTVHFGLENDWPASGAKMHGQGNRKWTWVCRHRNHGGKIFIEPHEPGIHRVTVSMREDGCELDRFLLTTDENYTPPTDAGPDPIAGN